MTMALKQSLSPYGATKSTIQLTITTDPFWTHFTYLPATMAMRQSLSLYSATKQYSFVDCYN